MCCCYFMFLKILVKLFTKNYDLDPVTFVTDLSLSWTSTLNKTEIELELLTDIYMIHIYENGIRGGKEGQLKLCKNCPYLGYSGAYSVRMRGNADQNNSEYGHFSRSVNITLKQIRSRKIILIHQNLL